MLKEIEKGEENYLNYDEIIAQNYVTKFILLCDDIMLLMKMKI